MASQAPIRRNDPCPCGSGRRYKECHGSLAPQAGVEALVRGALAAHQQGRMDEAEAGYRAILAEHPGHPVATHYLGLAAWQKGDPEGAERLMRAALEADASIADFHNNLGLLLRDTGRAEEAVACLRRALEVDPGYAGARSNLGLALESAGRIAEAVEAWRAALASHPADATMRQNVARALLTLGRFDEGWPEYRWRLLAQGLARTPPDASAKPLGQDLAGRQLALLAEQGLGDILFFLRFAPELAARGARLAFVGDARLHGMLSRTGLFALGTHAPGREIPACEPIALGDLPWLLEAVDPARFPPPLALAPLEERVAAMRSRLESLGPAPRIALTWRSGVASMGPSRTQVKQVGIEALGAALRGVHATWIGVQRLPGEAEREGLAQAIGAPVHDFSAANDDLESMLALLRVVDRSVGVSSTNTHLGASVGTSLDVLVAHPPEWRWMLGAASPWYPQARLYRERPGGDWRAALAQLAAALRA